MIHCTPASSLGEHDSVPLADGVLLNQAAGLLVPTLGLWVSQVVFMYSAKESQQVMRGWVMLSCSSKLDLAIVCSRLDNSPPDFDRRLHRRKRHLAHPLSLRSLLQQFNIIIDNHIR